MRIRLRLLDQLLRQIHDDLSRPHPFALERVGFLSCGVAELSADAVLIVAQDWHGVDDSDYIDDSTVGARIGPAAFRKVLQHAYRDSLSILHVHRHEHRGTPGFSLTDTQSMREFVPGFFNACQSRPHGALVLSHDSAAGAIWLRPGLAPRPVHRFEVIGAPLQFWRRA